jgi:GNAT superfamily N-acetyltransferase
LFTLSGGCDGDGLRAAGVTFWTMIEDGEILGCGAIKLLGHNHGEIKSMRVTPTRRHRGLGSALLRFRLSEPFLADRRLRDLGPSRWVWWPRCGPIRTSQRVIGTVPRYCSVEAPLLQ